MADNPYVNKVIYGENTLIDLTGDTVTPETLKRGTTAHMASGAPITGQMEGLPAGGTQGQVLTKKSATNYDADWQSDQSTASTTLGPTPIATFDASVADMPLKELVVNIEPVQAEGTPTPETPLPITGWTSAKVMRTGKNLWGGTLLRDTILASTPSATIDDSAHTISFVASAAVNFRDLLSFVGLDYKFKENTAYTIIISGYNTSMDSRSTNLRVVYTDGTTSSYIIFPTTDTSKQMTRFVTDVNKTVRTIGKYNNAGTTVLYYDECGIIEGDITADEFVPYIGDIYPIAFPTEAGTVYGGTLDVMNKKLTVTHWGQIFDGNYSGSANKVGNSPYYLIRCFSGVLLKSPYYCSHFPFVTINTENSTQGFYIYKSSGQADSWIHFRYNSLFNDKAEFLSWCDTQYQNGTPLTVVAQLATPIVYDLSNVPKVTTLLGENNIWADCGDVNVTYGAYLQTLKASLNRTNDEIDTLRACIAPIEDGALASQAYAAGTYFFRNGAFCVAQGNGVSAGGQFTLGTNYQVTTVAAALIALQS